MRIFFGSQLYSQRRHSGYLCFDSRSQPPVTQGMRSQYPILALSSLRFFSYCDSLLSKSDLISFSEACRMRGRSCRSGNQSGSSYSSLLASFWPQIPFIRKAEPMDSVSHSTEGLLMGGKLHLSRSTRKMEATGVFHGFNTLFRPFVPLKVN